MNNELRSLEAGIYNPPEHPEQTKSRDFVQDDIDYALLLVQQMEELDAQEDKAAA